MTSDSSINSTTPNPILRLHPVHRESPAGIARHQGIPEPAPAAREADARQARIVNNALRREIDRLTRSIDRIGPLLATESFGYTCDDDDRPPDLLAAPPPTNRCTHACWAHGHLVRYELPPDEISPPVLIYAPLLMTNTGSLLDLLA